MKHLPFIAMALGAMIVGCERHDFEETRKLHDKPGLAAPLVQDDAEDEAKEEKSDVHPE